MERSARHLSKAGCLCVQIVKVIKGWFCFMSSSALIESTVQLIQGLVACKHFIIVTHSDKLIENHRTSQSDL